MKMRQATSNEEHLALKRDYPKRKDLHEVTTPIWSEERGYRLMTIRRLKGLTQAHLAKDLGTSQVIISRIESGSLIVPLAPFTVARLMAVLPGEGMYILLGHNEAKYPWAVEPLKEIRKRRERSL